MIQRDNQDNQQRKVIPQTLKLPALSQRPSFTSSSDHEAFFSHHCSSPAPCCLRISNPEADPEPAKLVARSRVCSIVGNDGAVACRSLPSINAGQVGAKLPVGNSYTFSCYKGGSCVSNNWYVTSQALDDMCMTEKRSNERSNWDYIPGKGCYVPAYYTDASCTTCMLRSCVRVSDKSGTNLIATLPHCS